MTSVTVGHLAVFPALPSRRSWSSAVPLMLACTLAGSWPMASGAPLEGRRAAQPGLVLRGRHGPDVEEHQRVVQAAQLGALAAVDARRG